MTFTKTLLMASVVAGAGFAAAPVMAASDYSKQHIEWCSKTFTDYRASDNTYGNNTGDVQKQCSSPFDDKHDVVMREVQNPTFELAEPGKTYAQTHVEWCRKTHPTWNETTNTFTTESGMEKACSSPFN